MGVTDAFAPAGNMFGDGISSLVQYAWVLYAFVGLGVLVFVFFLVKMLTDQRKQWTHRLRVRRVGQNNLLSNDIEILKMRRFPLISRAEVFELEKPLLGGYLMPELGQYSGTNEYSIILDTNNRIWTNQGEYFCKDKSSVNVSAKHSEIDISRADLRADYQNINKTTKRVEWSQIAKYAMMGLLIIAVMIVSIKGIGAWGEAQDSKAASEQAQAAAMASLSDAMKTSQATMNTQVLILNLLKQNYGTQNLQPIIQEAVNGTL